ncbi:alkyl/aryl-sulfatase [Maricaulis parjimensis]|uniref:alkyl/aryl-sulfatase n=1 Tax=Maricaulis parjimensis TaxID=144023 RepID=UPI00193ABB5F|nr:alkyl sulfatase dimerization domain-containing protein [Maricaulis parjimensis]
MILKRHASALVLALAAAACSAPDSTVPVQQEGADAQGFLPADDTTLAAQAEAARQIDTDRQLADLELAERGLIAREADLTITAGDGRIIWQPGRYAFLDEAAPPTAHPDLWHQANLANLHGLYEVRPGIYQVRGYDLSNMSIIAGETGWIIIDPLTAAETARAALDLVQRELGERPIEAIIFTHSHIDHFGGVEGILPPEALASGEVRIIAPEGFTLESISENVLAGSVMSRRADYMFGRPLPASERGHISTGLGPQPAYGSVSIAPVTDTISRTGQTLTIDGVEMVFQHAPDSEAKAELTVFFPQMNAWCGAEIVSRTLHNLYTLRGAQVRDALAWSDAIEEARLRFAPQTDVIFNSHHWPVWGREEADRYLSAQRDIYKYIHDQTLRLASRGLTPDEIAETITLPDSLAEEASVHGYYGTLRHNSRAVYQRYFGWYDAVPAHLDPIPRTDAARRYVAAMGGLEPVLAEVETALADGETRWAAELAQHAVFADPDSAAARDALARTYEQLGYRARSGPWRDVYLTGAFELRHGVDERPVEAGTAGLVRAIPLDLYFDALSVRLDGPRAAERDLHFVFDFTDAGETFQIFIENGVMHHAAIADPEAATGDQDAVITLTRAFWLRLLSQQAGLADMLASEEFSVRGDRLALMRFFSLLEAPEAGFPIVTP